MTPTIIEFFGIVIQIFWREHAPPHFHALYGEHEALIDIQTLAVIQGGLPRCALSLTIEWTSAHREEWMEDWNLCQSKQLPKRIAEIWFYTILSSIPQPPRPGPGPMVAEILE